MHCRWSPWLSANPRGRRQVHREAAVGGEASAASRAERRCPPRSNGPTHHPRPPAPSRLGHPYQTLNARSRRHPSETHQVRSRGYARLRRRRRRRGGTGGRPSFRRGVRRRSGRGEGCVASQGEVGGAVRTDRTQSMTGALTRGTNPNQREGLRGAHRSHAVDDGGLAVGVGGVARARLLGGEW